MYNEEIKTRFVQQYTSSLATARVCESIFNACEPFEVNWGDDLCTRSEEELQPMIDAIVGLRARSKWMRLIVLKDYVKWCIGVARVPGACDGMLKINSVGLDKIKQQTVANPIQLQKYLDDLFEDKSANAADNKTTDNIYRCYYWLAYGGVAEEDILKVKCSDVDFENMVVRYKETEIPIYREAIPAFRNCVELTHFDFRHPSYTKTVWRARAEGDTLVRGIRTVSSVQSMRVELSRRAKKMEWKTGIRLSYYRTWISGVFYRTYEREIAGEKPDFKRIAAERTEGKTYKLDSGRNTEEAKKRQRAGDYMEDYQRWKLAFKI